MTERYITIDPWEMHGFERGDRIESTFPDRRRWWRPFGRMSVVTHADRSRVYLRDYHILDWGADVANRAWGFIASLKEGDEQ